MLTGRWCGGTPAIGWPSMAIDPASGVSKPAMSRISVVLPQPEGPSSEKNSPRPISSEIPATALTPPKLLPRSRMEIADEAAVEVMRIATGAPERCAAARTMSAASSIPLTWLRFSHVSLRKTCRSPTCRAGAKLFSLRTDRQRKMRPDQRAEGAQLLTKT